MSHDYDLIIVGAGIAGSSAALALAPAGYRILLLDKETFPRHKPCGEGLMPQGVTILERLGMLPALLAAGAAKVRGIKFRSVAGDWATGDFPDPGDGSAAYSLVMRRYELDALLLERVRACPNVTVREGFQVTELRLEGETVCGVAGHPTGERDRRVEFRAPLTLGADGITSMAHGQAGIRKTTLPRKRFGLAGHLRGVTGLSAYIEVLHRPEYEIYVAPANAGLTLVAVLLEESLVKAEKRPLVERYLDFLRAAPEFADRIAGAELVPPVGARGPFAYTVTPMVRPGLLLLGDSAGFLDPITGEGMTLALKCMEAARPMIHAAFARGDFSAAALEPYVAAREAIVADIWQLTEMMLEVTRLEWVTNRAIRRLSRDPALFQKLLGIVTGATRYRDFTLKDKIALGLG